MNDPMSFQTGQDGFVWWLGIVEDLANDTLKIGRAKVRILGWHGTKDDIPTNDLPWAIPLAPVTAAQQPVPNYKHGDWVIGFFLDGKLGQQPMIAWVLPAIPQGGGLFGKLAKTALKTAARSQGIPI